MQTTAKSHGKRKRKNPIETLNESHALRTSYVCDFFCCCFVCSLARSLVYSFSFPDKVLAIEKVVAAVVWYLLLVKCFFSSLSLLFDSIWRVCVRCSAATTLLNALFNCTINFSLRMDDFFHLILCAIQLRVLLLLWPFAHRSFFLFHQ